MYIIKRIIPKEQTSKTKEDAMRKSERNILLGLFLLMLIFIALGGWMSKKADNILMPKPTPLDIWLPKSAEIRPDSEIHPGTFSVTIPIEEFIKRFPADGLVSYPKNLYAGPRIITIWKAEPGGLFYRTTQSISKPQSWPNGVSIKSLGKQNGAIVAYPENNFAGLIGFFYGVACVFVASILAIAFVLAFVLRQRKKKTSTIVPPSEVCL